MNTELPNAERVHHPYSPSTLQSREACPCWDSEFSESEASKTGTMQHDVAETGVDNPMLADIKALAVVECLKFVDSRIALYPGGQHFKEIYLPIDDRIVAVTCDGKEFLTDPEDPDSGTAKTLVTKQFIGTTAGYVDVGLVSADELTIEVIDYKFGKQGVEEAGNNVQGISYLLGLKKKFPKAKRGIAWFYLPHRDEISGAEFDLTDTTKKYLRIKTIVERAIEAHKTPGDFSMANPTESGCLFCANLGKCPKVAELALKLGKKYAPLQIPQSVSTTVFTDPADLERGLKFAAVIKTWAEAFRNQATAKTIDDPNFVPEGYNLVSMTKRKVLSAKKLGELAKEFLSTPEFKEKVELLYDISFGPLEDLIKLSAPRGQKEKTVDAFSAKALEQKIIEMGQPFAFLQQSRKTVAKAEKPT